MQSKSRKAITLAGIGLATVTGLAVMDPSVHADDMVAQVNANTSKNALNTATKAYQNANERALVTSMLANNPAQGKLPKALSTSHQLQLATSSQTNGSVHINREQTVPIREQGDQGTAGFQNEQVNSYDNQNMIHDDGVTTKVTSGQLLDGNGATNNAEQNQVEERANLVNDSALYGNVITVEPLSDVTLNGSIPETKIANPMVANPAELIVANFIKIDLGPVPAGTKVAWLDYDQVKADMGIVGHHVEKILVTFPDGSTVIKKVAFNVVDKTAGSQEPSTDGGKQPGSKPTTGTGEQPGSKPTGTEKPSTTTPDKPTTSTGEQTGSKQTDTEKPAPTTPKNPMDSQPAPATPDNPTGTAGQPGGSQLVAGGQGNGTGVTDNQTTGMVAGGRQGMMNSHNQAVQQAGANGQMKLSAQARSQQTQANAALPRTGADHDQGLLALGMAGLVTMFGLLGINRKQRN